MYEAYDFLDSYSRDRKFFLSLPTLWKVNFQYSNSGALAAGQQGQLGSASNAPTGLPSAIQRALNDADEGWRVKNEPDQFEKNGSVLAAREITVPQENTQFIAPGGEINKGNYLPAFGAERRMNFLERNLAINFFDTEEDLEHTFFRPWMIAVATHGLIERDLLCPIVELSQYNNRGEIRKGYKFVDVFPTNVEGYNLNYNNTEFLEKSVTFAFKNYIQV
tara:strand:- start:11078 stop:11737 length:660 start_codon:yes stop_codon:yes gene_type:complete